MPRKGKGQKVQTATGQQYGQAKMQEESQGVVALPEMEEPQIPTMRPGESAFNRPTDCLLYTSPSPRDQRGSRMPSSA